LIDLAEQHCDRALQTEQRLSVSDRGCLPLHNGTGEITRLKNFQEYAPSQGPIALFNQFAVFHHINSIDVANGGQKHLFIVPSLYCTVSVAFLCPVQPQFDR